MSLRIADRLIAARQRLIVGRASELATFQSALQAEELPFQLLYIYGPGGVGKTTLLNEFLRVAGQTGTAAYYIDARDVEASPEAFLNTLQQTMGIEPSTGPMTHLASLSNHPAVLIDTYETLAPLDDWLSKHFFPQLPENVLVVLAGRHPPSQAWRADPGWQSLIRVLPLRNLSPGESRSYLLKRDIPLDQHQTVLDFTHGHPLALSLVADVFAQRQGTHFLPEETPDVVKTLLEQFVQKVPSPAHRTALESCALVRTTTEALLGEMLAMTDASIASQGVHELFEWLRELSFIESGREGIFPHDLARESLVADLRWRNPDWYAELHRRARNYFTNRLAQASTGMQQYILMDYIFLHRDNPVVRPFFEWQSGGSLLSDAFHESDRGALLDMVSRFEGKDSAKIASHWFSRQPHNILVIRDPDGKPVGFLAMVSLQEAEEIDFQVDPGVKNAVQYLNSYAPPRSGERATHFRFWMDSDSYQAISPTQTLIVINLVRHYLTTPGLAYTIFPVADAGFWAPLGAYANLSHITAADYEVGGKRYYAFGHDWRLEPPLAWLSMLAEREIAVNPLAAQPPSPARALVVLSQAEFAGAVQESLRNFTRPNGMEGNPLLRSRLVADQAGLEAGENGRSESLRALLRQAAEVLRSSPRETKLYRALYHTYFQPAPTQEAAAETLDLPFSTYRRHLKTGITRIVEILWQWEIGGLEK